MTAEERLFLLAGIELRRSTPSMGTKEFLLGEYQEVPMKNTTDPQDPSLVV